MAREWTEFVQSQKLPWQSDAPAALGAGTALKRLSEDADSGALSALVRYPAGYRSDATALAADEEFLVLDGELVIGGRRFGPYSYAHWPAGFDAGSRASDRGAVVLAFYSAAPSAAARAAYDPERLVEHCDTFEVPYTGNFHPEFPPGAGRKVLFTDPETAETSWLLGTLPMRWAERSEVHPYVEEMYLLSGESHGDRGVMRPGAYFWRPGGIPHGPYGTLTGNLYFFRTRGGGLETDYVEPRRPFHWWPAYEPELPVSLGDYGGEVDRLARCW